MKLKKMWMSVASASDEWQDKCPFKIIMGSARRNLVHKKLKKIKKWNIFDATKRCKLHLAAIAIKRPQTLGGEGESSVPHTHTHTHTDTEFLHVDRIADFYPFLTRSKA